MASVSAMGVKAAHARGRRRSASWSASDMAAVKIQLEAKRSLKIESKKVEEIPAFPPGFAKEPPLLMRPLMMIDPSHYHHLRKWAIRLIP